MPASRLQLLFNDPLFVRTPAGMEPTARAEAIAGETPGVDLRFRFLEYLLFDAIDAGDVGLAAAVLPDPPKHLATEPLIAEGFVCVPAATIPRRAG